MKNLSTALAGDVETKGVTVTFIDLDGDGNVSVGDVFRVSNMTDGTNGAVLEVYRDGATVAREDLSWDVDDPSIYSAFLYWNYPVEANGSRWDTNFSVTHLAIPFEVPPANLTFEVVGEDGQPLEDAAVVFEEYRDVGMLSDFDRVHVLGMTEDYQRARVRMYLDGTLVAIGTVPQWIF
jgi:hypothetical protein